MSTSPRTAQLGITQSAADIRVNWFSAFAADDAKAQIRCDSDRR
jgi:hypothetical protein